MNTRQQVVTGILAMVIVGSIALMPVNANTRTTHASPPAAAQATRMAATQNQKELPQEQVKDLTYN